MDSEPTNGKLFSVNQQHASIHQLTQHITVNTDIHNSNVPSLGLEQQHAPRGADSNGGDDKNGELTRA